MFVLLPPNKNRTAQNGTQQENKNTDIFTIRTCTVYKKTIYNFNTDSMEENPDAMSFDVKMMACSIVLSCFRWINHNGYDTLFCDVCQIYDFPRSRSTNLIFAGTLF